MKSIFVVTSDQKILDYIIGHPGREFLASEIQRKLKISKGGVNQSLRRLARRGLVNREKKGKVFLYSLKHSDAVVKQFKILKNIELIRPLLNKLKDNSERIILFGSSARGEDSTESDIDLFILTKNSDEVIRILKKYKFPRKIQFIIRTPAEYMKMERKEPVFYGEINKGVRVWERRG